MSALARPDAGLGDARVSVVRVGAIPADDVAIAYADEAVERALGEATRLLGWGTEDDPFGAVIPAGASVVVKPNWVLHANEGPWGIEALVTHAAVVRVVVAALLRTGARSILVGDAPIQSCDFGRLVAVGGLDRWAAELSAREPRFRGIQDFRRTKSIQDDGLLVASTDQRGLEHFVLFDLGPDSLLEAVTDEDDTFRVTCYPPELMAKTHTRGKHQYLVAREILEADVLVNLPKLKTHRKAGITCALKNLIGINGNKEFLPHHRLGGSGDGGDCYPGSSVVKRALERTLDVQNSIDGQLSRRALGVAVRALYKVAHLGGDRLGVDGAWSGNDTIWRTCIDLNRILLYGRTDGAMADIPQRRVLNVVDAIVAGHGDGPLAPQPLPLGLLLASASSTAMDWAGARLLGYDPHRIPISRGAFHDGRWPIAAFRSGDVELTGALGEGASDALLAGYPLPSYMSYPPGWQDAVASPHGAVHVAPEPRGEIVSAEG